MNKLLHIVLGALAALLAAGTLCFAQDPAPANYAFPAPGTRWQMAVNNDGKASLVTSTVLEDGDYQGQKVHRVSMSDGEAEPSIDILDLDTGNWITTLVGGVPHRGVYAKPHNALFSWPLTTDKRWRADFLYGSYGPHEMRVYVDAYEEVTVPAGTFKAYKVIAADPAGRWYRTTYWYAPSIGLVVKREDWAKQKGRKQSELKAYRLVAQ